MKRAAHSAIPDEQVRASTGQSGLDRRSFLETFLFSAAGVTALGSVPMRASAAWVQWSPPQASLMLGEDPTPGLEEEGLEIAGGLALGDPVIARTDGGLIWVAWTEMEGDDERIFLRAHNPKTGEWSETRAVNAERKEGGAPALAYQPQMVALGNRLQLAWTEQVGGVRRIVTRSVETDGVQSEVSAQQIVAEAIDCGRPALSPFKEGTLLVWEEKIDSHHAILAQQLDGRGVAGGESFGLSQEGSDCRRPHLATSPTTGAVAFAFDRNETPGSHSLMAGTLEEDGRITYLGVRTLDEPASDIAPALSYSHDGRRLWIGWHSNQGADGRWDIPRWFRLAVLDTETGALSEPSTPPRDKDVDKRETDQGWEFVRLVPCPDGGVWVIGRPSHNWCLQRYRGGEWSPIYRLPVDGWGGRGKLASALLDGGALWVARRDIRANVLQRIEGAVSEEEREPALRRVVEPSQRTLVNIEKPVRFPAESVGEEETAEELNFYFGDIHGHTYMSDGMGDVDEYFLRCRDLHGDDLCACTDHDNFVGQRLLNSEYEEHKRAVEHFHEDGRFVTLYAQEWTTARPTRPTGYGHINFYTTSPDHPLMDHLDPRWQHQRDVMAVCKEHGMIGGPHHVAWVGHRWEEHDPEVIRFVEICSVHGVFEHEGNEPIAHRGNFPGCFVQDGLARGMKFGLVGGSDQHGLIWHHRVCWKRNAYRAGLTGVLAPELTREAIFEALRNRRTFATTGVKMRMGFKVNGAIMGSEITSEGPPSVHVDLVAPTDIRWIDLVRSNERILRYGGESLQTFFSFTDEVCPVNEEVWYYLRVILDTGDMAWSSPIWVTRTA